MKIHPNQLTQQLQQGLSSIYIVSGDIPLLVEEIRNQIRHAAENQGFKNRELFQVEKGFEWQQLLMSANSLSLFSSKSVLELYLTSNKLTDAGSEALQYYAASPPPDKILIITTSKLDANTQKNKWFSVLEKKAIVITVWPIDKTHYPAWLTERLKRVNLQTDHEGLRVLADRTEGNLLAAKQAIEKLSLLYGKGKLSSEEIVNVISDTARFNVFHLIDHILQAHQKKVVRIVAGLQQEGTDPMLVLWALAREIRNLAEMAFTLQQGQNVQLILQKFQIWEKRKPLVKAILQRHHYEYFLKLLQQIQEIDEIIKGFQTGNVWDKLLTLSLALS